MVKIGRAMEPFLSVHQGATAVWATSIAKVNKGQYAYSEAEYRVLQPKEGRRKAKARLLATSDHGTALHAALHAALCFFCFSLGTGSVQSGREAVSG